MIFENTYHVHKKHFQTLKGVTKTKDFPGIKTKLTVNKMPGKFWNVTVQYTSTYAPQWEVVAFTGGEKPIFSNKAFNKVEKCSCCGKREESLWYFTRDSTPFQVCQSCIPVVFDNTDFIQRVKRDAGIFISLEGYDTEPDEPVEEKPKKKKKKSSRTIPRNSVIAAALQTIMDRGFYKSKHDRASAKEMTRILSENPNIKISNEIEEEIMEYVNNETDGAFGIVCREFMQNDEMPAYSFGFVAAAVHQYLETKQMEEYEFLGNIGEKFENVPFYVYEIRPYKGVYGDMKIVTLRNTKHNLVWFASSRITIEQGQSLNFSFTVKEHGEYKGIPQTYIKDVKYVFPEEKEDGISQDIPF